MFDTTIQILFFGISNTTHQRFFFLNTNNLKEQNIIDRIVNSGTIIIKGIGSSQVDTED